MKLLHIVGTRPQFIKLAPVWGALRHHDQTILHTGQHHDADMSDQLFRDLDIAPNYRFSLPDTGNVKRIANMMESINDVVDSENPDLLIIYGDTDTTLAAAVAGTKLNIPIAHVEAGLRSFNKSMPEENNRVVADHLSRYLFAPTATAVQNLANENVHQNVHLVGDVMVDSLKFALSKRSNITDMLRGFGRHYYLLTLHRPYNVDDVDDLRVILNEVGMLDIDVVFPVHPRTKRNLKNLKCADNIVMMPPMGYVDFVHLMNSAAKVITDSGGIQKEAHVLRKPCITVRSETEWVETIESGWNILTKDYTVMKSFVPTQPYRELFAAGASRTIAKIINNIERTKS